MAETLSVRLPTELVKRVNQLARAAGQARSDLLRDVIQRGLAAKRLELALDAYRKGEVSLGRASEMAGLPITVFLDEMRRAGVLLNYSLEDLRHDLAQAGRA